MREGQRCRPHAMKTKSKASQLGQTNGDCDADCDCNCDCDAGNRATEICSQLFVCVSVCWSVCVCALHANYCGKLRARAAQHKTMSRPSDPRSVCECVGA